VCALLCALGHYLVPCFVRDLFVGLLFARCFARESFVGSFFISCGSAFVRELRVALHFVSLVVCVGVALPFGSFSCVFGFDVGTLLGFTG
jgi:hypothetical protein